MNTTTICRMTLLPLLAAVGLLTACSRQSEPAGHDDHAGHQHGEVATLTNAPPGVKMCKEHNVPLEECGICRPLLAGTLITYFGSYGRAAVIVSMIYILGIVAAPFFPETRGKPLPE